MRASTPSDPLPNLWGEATRPPLVSRVERGPSLICSMVASVTRPHTIASGLVLVALCLASLLVGCQAAQEPTPVVIIVVVTATPTATAAPTQTPYVIVREVTVVVTATPTPSRARSTMEPPELPSTSGPKASATFSPSTPEATPTPTSASIPAVQGASEETPSPSKAAQEPAAVAEELLSQGIHTMQISTIIDVPLEIQVATGSSTLDAVLTKQLTRSLPAIDAGADLVIDISLDDLARGRWVLKAIGSTSALGNLQTTEVVQIHETIWHRTGGDGWMQQTLSADEASLPLAGIALSLGDSEQSITLGDLVLLMFAQLGSDYESALHSEAGEPSEWQYLGRRTEDDGVLHGVHRQTELLQAPVLEAILSYLKLSELSDTIPEGVLDQLLRDIQSNETIWFEEENRRVTHTEHQVISKAVTLVSILGGEGTAEIRTGVTTAGDYLYFPGSLRIQPPG